MNTIASIPHSQSRPPRAIVFTDLDGTLLDDQKRISPQAASIIHGLVDQGIPFCPVTARSPRGVDPIWRQLGFYGPLAAFSGGYVLDQDGEELYSCTIPLADAIEIKRFLNADLSGVVVNAFGFDTWITDDSSSPRVQDEERVVELKATPCPDLAAAFDERGIHKFLLMGAPDDLTIAERQIRGRYSSLAVARSNANLVEVTATGATKEHAIDVLCAHFGLTRQDAVAFGDGHNDIPMLSAVPQSYAVANASEEVRRAAAHVCEQTNNEDAVALTLEALLDPSAGVTSGN